MSSVAAPGPVNPSGTGGANPSAAGSNGAKGPARPESREPRGTPSISTGAETYLAVGVVSIVALLVVPLPALALDLFLAVSFALSIVILLVVITVRDPLDFNIFPSLLLLITLLRLGLNVSSTRLILSSGRAGDVIDAFGDFVVAGNLVVGLVIFLILVVINFMVITKGAGRVAEVAARFTLDAMPGRQMSIDADLGAGLIDEHEARARREDINRYADFYGSMDGAAKFVRGDAVAGLIITGINLVGGFVIGMTQRGLSAEGALGTYTTLTVGDGLVTQIPALIVSTAAGILVTYGSSGTSVAPSLGRQLTQNPRMIWTASGILCLFAAVPGLPPIPFLLPAAGAAGLAYWINRRRSLEEAELLDREDEAAAPATPFSELLTVEPLELEVGYGLIFMVDESQGGDLVQRIGVVRKQLALELGIVLPSVRVRDNVQLPANRYAVKVRGVQVATGDLLPRQLLALDTQGVGGELEGVPTRDPSFGISGVWIQHDQRVRAEAEGYTVVDAKTVLTTHLMETIRQHAGDLLSRQNVRDLLDSLKDTHPSLVEDVVPGRVSLGTLHRVLQRLIREGVPIRDLVTILETVSDASEQVKDPEQMTEYVRRALSLVISQILRGPESVLRVITVGPRLEVALMQLFSPSADGGRGPEPSKLTAALEELDRRIKEVKREGALPPLLTPPALRLGIRRLVEPSFPRLPVISMAELPPQTPVETLAVWELPDES